MNFDDLRLADAKNSAEEAERVKRVKQNDFVRNVILQIQQATRNGHRRVQISDQLGKEFEEWLNKKGYETNTSLVAHEWTTVITW
jgi:hypothetical protein